MEQKPVRILVVDDEPDLVWALQYSLADEGYEVLTAYDGVAALNLARLHHPDLIILDVVMPGLDGLEVCRRLRRDPALAAVPILFLSVRNNIESRIKGLNEGSDDYLVKPFDLRELKARIRALLRRSRITVEASTGFESTLRAGPFILDLDARQIHLGEKIVQLTPTEFGLLRYLILHPGEVFSSEKLLQAVWGYAPGTAVLSLVRWHIKNLRTKIEPDPVHPTYIRTVPQQGYVWLYGP